ncbi:MAG: MBL fold metallo-hydrolase [Phycisphaerae bacterium]|jgi:ribonuclease Z
MPSHRLHRVETDKFDILGYSVAGEETVIAIPGLDVCFDIGKAPEQVIPINNMLLTHGHIDHTSGIAYYLSHRQFCDQRPGTVYGDKFVVEHIERLAELWGELDGSRIPAKYEAVEEGKYYRIKQNLFIVPFKTRHNHDSWGYTIVERRKKLRSEYLGLDQKAIVKLKNEGVNLTVGIEIPLVSFTGDTAFAPYWENALVRDSEVLIIECTFFEPDHKEKAKAGKHLHITELAEMLAQMNNKKIVLTHFSQRTHIRDAKKRLEEVMPAYIFEKTVILMDYGRQNSKKEN